MPQGQDLGVLVPIARGKKSQGLPPLPVQRRVSFLVRQPARCGTLPARCGCVDRADDDSVDPVGASDAEAPAGDAKRAHYRV
jgi:hypothetical protein